MIEIRNLTKQFGKQMLFHDFNLKIEDGEFVVVMGKSGCGKTTLLNMIGGIEAYDSGVIAVDGSVVGKRNTQLNYFRQTVGFLFQNFALVEQKTVKQNLEMIKPRYRTGCTMEEALERVGLADKTEEKVYRLSGGEQQRVALARLMLKKCSVVLADEPTGALDSKSGKQVLELFDMLNESGVTIVMITHDRKVAERAKRIVHIIDGEISEEGQEVKHEEEKGN